MFLDEKSRVFFWQNALFAQYRRRESVFSRRNAGKAITGASNLRLGSYAGDNITSGSGNVVIGNADVPSATGGDQLSISSGDDGSVVWLTGDSAGKLVATGGDVVVGKIEGTNFTDSLLIGHFIEKSNWTFSYADPLTDDNIDEAKAIILMAHNREITYGYALSDNSEEFKIDNFYFKILPGSHVVDPWRRMESNETYTVHHYGNTR